MAYIRGGDMEGFMFILLPRSYKHGYLGDFSTTI